MVRLLEKPGMEDLFSSLNESGRDELQIYVMTCNVDALRDFVIYSCDKAFHLKTVRFLRRLAGDLKIKNYSMLDKEGLISQIKEVLCAQQS